MLADQSSGGGFSTVDNALTSGLKSAFSEPDGPLRVEAPPARDFKLPDVIPDQPTEEEIRQKAKEYWAYLMDYHDRWGCFPWQRHLLPSSSEYRYEVDPKQRAEDHREYCRALAILRQEAEVRVPFIERFQQAAQKAQQSPQWFEQMMTVPQNTLDTTRLSTPEEAAQMLRERGQDVQAGELLQMSTGQMLDLLLRARCVSQSCGQTAGQIHEILSPSTASSEPISMDISAIKSAILIANAKAKKGPLQYLRIEGGGHAFIIEVSEGRCRIYQSFFGAYTLAEDMAVDAIYDTPSFLELLETAVTIDTEEEVAREVVQARRTLFKSRAFHPEETFRVIPFEQEPGAQERLEATHGVMSAQWTGVLDSSASDHLATPPEDVTPLTGTQTINLRDGDYQFYTESYTAISSSVLEEGKTYVCYYKGAQNLSVQIVSIDKDAGTCVMKIIG